MSSVSVVISVFSIERANHVLDCIESLKRQTIQPKDIVVVLDPDESLIAYYHKLLDSSVKLVISDAFGLSSARNKGISYCDTEIVAFIDDDATAEPDWLCKLVNNFSNPSIIGFGGRIIPLWPSKPPNWFPAELYWIVGCSYQGLPTKKAFIRNPIGCNMAFRRHVFEKAGYFSTTIGRVGNVLMGHDDTEFGIRATSKLLDTKIVYDPEAIVYHRVSANRVSLRYVIRRSYSEGFSKAFVTSHQKYNNTLGTEKDYFLNILSGIPKMLIYGDVKTGFLRCWTLWVATAMVFFGYAIGSRSS
ncbi:MAG: glycosyltransferase family 2 protein [Candidatus Bathyarchaeia archaeon]|jgi:glycosyltransferase involved in cell wall biosynthesis